MKIRSLNGRIALAMFALTGFISVFYIYMAVQSTRLYQQEIQQKLNRTLADHIAQDIPLQEVEGAPSGDLLVLSWGGTYGACVTAVREIQATGKSVSHAHLRYLNPFPRNLEDLLGSFKQVLIPELNMGQLRMLIRAKYLIDAKGYNKVQGRPFSVTELVAHINTLL